MKALDPEKQLRRDSKGGGGDLHKPGADGGDAKKQAFEKHQTSRPRKPNKNKKDDDKKKLIAAGIGVAAVAGIGVTYAIAHNTGSKTASEKANEHSSDTGLNFGDDSDSESSSSSSKKKSKSLFDSDDSDSSSKKKSSKKKSSSKSKNKLDSLLDGDSSDSDDSDTSLDTILGDDFSQLGGSGSGSSLSALAAQAKKSASSAKNLGSGSGSSSKLNSSKSNSSKSSKSSGKGSRSDSSPEVTEVSNTGGSGKISALDKKSSNGSTSTKVPAGSNNNVTNGKKTVEKTVNTPASPSNGTVSQSGSNSSKGGSSNGSSPSNGSTSGSSSSNGGSNNSSSSGSSNSGSSSSKDDSKKDDNKNSSNSNSGSKGNNDSSSNSGSNSGNNSNNNSGNSSNSGSSSTDTPSTDGSTETKTITYLNTYGDNLGQGKLTKTTKDGKTTYALDDSVPNGYWVSNTDQLTNYPDYVAVQSVGTSTDENGNTLLTQKTVSYVDKSSGQTISQGIIYKWQSADGKVFCTADNLGNGYTVDLTDEELNKYPSVIYVTKQADFKYPAQDVADGTSKQVTVTTTDGTNVGTATLAKDGNNVTITGIPKGYHLSDLDDDGSQQLLYWPDTVTVVKDADQTYPADDIKAGTSKEITYRTSDGAEVGTGTITKNEDGSVSVSDIPGGYKLADLDDEGHSKQLLDWPDLVDVVKISSSGSESGGGSTSGSGSESGGGSTSGSGSESGGGSTSGSGSESGGGSSSGGIHPSDSIAAGTTKAVDLVDTKTNQTIGTGKLTKQEDGSVLLTGIPQNYKLSDLDADGHSPQLLNWPDSITVVSTSTTPSTPDNPDTPSTSESKEIPVVDADDGGKQIGTVKIVKNATTGKWTLDPSATLPEGYHLKDSEAVDSGPDKLELVKNSSGTDTPKPEETTKQVKFVDESGKDMGTGSLKQGDDGKWAVVKTTLPDGYKLKDSAAAESGPDQLVVVKVDTSTKPTSTSKQITYVDESGKEVGTATLIKEYDGTSNFNYKLDGKVPYGYLLKDEDQLKKYPDKVTVVADPTAAPKGESSKEVTFVLADGTEVGKGTLTRTVDDNGNAHFTLGKTMTKGYQVLNNDENVLKTYPDKIVVEKVTVTNTEVVDVTYVDESGKKVGTGKMTVKTYSSGAKTWELDASIPSGWKLKEPLNGETTITLVKTK